MITSLSIKNYALIDELNIKFSKGLTTITGETGAGKSIIIGALTLLLGNRANPTVINDKTKKCVVEAIFDIKNYNLKEIFTNQQIDYFDTTIIRREIAPEGRSRAFINDTPVNLTTLKTITEKIIDIHSQHDTLKLNNANFQTQTIDLVAENQKILEKYQKTFGKYNTLKKQLTELKENAQKEKNDLEYYKYQFNQIEQAKLNPNEQKELENEQKKLTNAQEIKENLSKIYLLINNEDNAIIQLLKEAQKSAEILTKFLPQATDFLNRIQSTTIDLQDIQNEIDIINNDLQINPEKLHNINNRLDTIYNLQHKFNTTSVTELINIKNKFEQKIKKISSFDKKIDEITTEIIQNQQKLSTLAEEIHQSRIKIKKTIENKIIKIVENLGMNNTTFNINITKTKNFTNTGTDNITFLFSANKNIQPQPITKIASGGELSRLMLAIKYILAQSKTLPTIIFDEIDTGISGNIAAKMGNLLKKLAHKIQIISITHLPQIAAKGNQHLFVYKDDTKNKTTTFVSQLTHNQRVMQIAKMLSGANISDSAIQNAKELLTTK